MSEQIMPEDFERLIRKFYKFLEDDFGFSIKKLNDWAFVAETGSTRLSIYLEYYSALVVEIEPIGEGASQLLRQNILPSSMTILSIIKYYAPDLQYKNEMLNENNFVDNISVELERRASLLQKYFTKLLMGDYSDWPKIKKYLSDLAYKRK